VSGIVDLLKKSENELVFLFKAESAGSHKKLSHISSSLSGVSVKGEESVKLRDMIGGENWVLGSDVFSKDGLEFLFLNFSLGHIISFTNK